MIEFKIIVDHRNKHLEITRAQQDRPTPDEKKFADLLLSFVDAICKGRITGSRK